MNDSYKKLETSTIELKKFRSNTDEISTAGRSRRKRIIIIRRKKQRRRTTSQPSVPLKQIRTMNALVIV